MMHGPINIRGESVTRIFYAFVVLLRFSKESLISGRHVLLLRIFNIENMNNFIQ